MINIALASLVVVVEGAAKFAQLSKGLHYLFMALLIQWELMRRTLHRVT